MLNPKYQRYADRLHALIEEGKNLVAKSRKSEAGGSYIPHPVEVEAWHVKTRNILLTLFGEDKAHYQLYESYMVSKDSNNAYRVNRVVGLLTGALDDLENGFLQGQEFIVAGEVFDSVLEQAKFLNSGNYKDPAAVLTRVVLEDALKRLAKDTGIDDSQKASKLNDDLKSAGKYSQPQWRRIQAMLDVGNAAAHGKFNTFTESDVTLMIEDVERFLAAHF